MLRLEDFPLNYMRIEEYLEQRYALLRMPSIQTFPEVIDWTVKPDVGYYMFILHEDDTMDIMWGETKIEDPAVAKRRAELLAAKVK